MNSLSGSSYGGAYQLFSGYHPIRAAVEEYFGEQKAKLYTHASKEETKSSELPKENKELKPLSSMIVGIERYIPKIDSKNIEANYQLNRGKLNTWRKYAYYAIQRKDYSNAMIFYKKICEVTVFEVSNWRAILTFAKSHFRETIPAICEQILIHCPDVRFQKEVKEILNSKK